jgi:hypothetical protein
MATNPPPINVPNIDDTRLQTYLKQLKDAVYLLWFQVNKGSTVAPTGTTGAQTINTLAGSVNFAAAASSLVVTNSLVSTDSVILATVATNDATMKTALCVAAAGSFTIHANAAATAETRVNFLVIN